MDYPVSSPLSNIRYFEQPASMQDVHPKDTVMKNTPLTNANIFATRFADACTVYTAKGLKGDKNSNFYEFLTLGMVPYTIGSIMLISLFNAATRHFNSRDAANASKIGIKAGLGVIFYALAKNFSKKLVDTPVKMATGIDVNLPYKKIVHELPEPGNNDPIRKEYHRVQESIEFPRSSDMFPNYKAGPNQVNNRFDKIAKKLGHKEELVDSDQLVKPKIREIVTKTKTLTYLTQYLWAFLGVGLAFQSPWERYVDPKGSLPWTGGNWSGTIKNTFNKLKHGFSPSGIKFFGQTFWDSAKEFHQSTAGKIGFYTTVAVTALGTAKIINDAWKKDRPVSGENKIDPQKDYTVS